MFGGPIGAWLLGQPSLKITVLIDAPPQPLLFLPDLILYYILSWLVNNGCSHCVTTEIIHMEGRMNDLRCWTYSRCLNKYVRTRLWSNSSSGPLTIWWEDPTLHLIAWPSKSVRETQGQGEGADGTLQGSRPTRQRPPRPISIWKIRAYNLVPGQAVFPDKDGHENWVGVWGLLGRGRGEGALCPSCPIRKRNFSGICASVSRASSPQGPALGPCSRLPPLPHHAPPPPHHTSRAPRPLRHGVPRAVGPPRPWSFGHSELRGARGWESRL